MPPSIAWVSQNRYWNFNRQNVSNFSSGTIQIYYDIDDSVTNHLSVSVAHDDGAGNWLDLAGTATADNTGNITSTTFSQFNNQFTLGFPPGALPVELAWFNAVRYGQDVQCRWSTFSEVNNDYFTVERSLDGITFDSILAVRGYGTTSAVHYYEAKDA